MSDATRMARRYHWLSTGTASFVCEPHAAVCCDARSEVLNLVALESDEARRAVHEVACRPPQEVARELGRLHHLVLPRRHAVTLADIDPQRLDGILLKTYHAQPAGFESLLTLPGVGPKTMRALSLVAELIYGAIPSFKDPARYSFAHGGKDGTPYPVDRALYDRTIDLLGRAIRRARLDRGEELGALRRLERAFAGTQPAAAVRPRATPLPNATGPGRAQAGVAARGSKGARQLELFSSS